MSETLTIDDDAPEQRPGGRQRDTSRRHRPEPEGYNEPPVTFEQGGLISPEDALADSRAQIERAETRALEAQRLAAAASQREQQAAQQLAATTAARATDHHAVVASVVETAKAEQASARIAYRTAREAGDIDAEIAATEAMSSANVRLANAQGELARIQAQPKPQQAPPQQQQAAGPSPEAQRWIDEHPAYQTDAAYRGRALAAHEDAVRSGCIEGSPAYIRFIDQEMTATYGEGHGRTAGAQPLRQGNQQDMNRNQPPRSDSAPPSRGNSQGAAGHGGFVRQSTPAGDLLVKKNGTGGMSIRFTSDEQRAAFEDAASFSKMSLAEYSKSMLEGGSDDLKIGEGQRFGA